MWAVARATCRQGKTARDTQWATAAQKRWIGFLKKFQGLTDVPAAKIDLMDNRLLDDVAPRLQIYR